MYKFVLKHAKNHQKGGGFYRFIILRGSQTCHQIMNFIVSFFDHCQKGRGFPGFMSEIPEKRLKSVKNVRKTVKREGVFIDL